MPPDPARVEQAAAALLKARRSGQRLTSLPEAFLPRDEAEAYAIQRAQFAALGFSVGGWKSTMLDATTGIYAPIASSLLLPTPARLTPASAPSAGSREFGIEPEIAFRMGQTLDRLPVGLAERRATVVDAIASAHPVIEIVVTRYVDSEAVSQLERLADHILNEALIVGAPYSEWRSLAIADLPLEVSVDGRSVYTGRGGHPLNDPLLPVVWLAGALLEHGTALEQGQIVTTGSCNGLRLVPAGQSARADFGPLGSAQVQF